MLNVKVTIIFLFIFAYGMGQNASQFQLDSLNKRYLFYFTGECHTKKDYKYTFELIKHLYITNKVRRVILELPQEYEFVLNQYINDSTSKDSDNIFLFEKHHIQKQIEFYQFIEKLRLFNHSLEKEKISIVCPDISKTVDYAFYKIGLIKMLGVTHNEYVNKYIDNALTVKRIHLTNNQYKKTVKNIYNLKTCLEIFESDFKDLYKENFLAVKREINCLYKVALAYQKYKVIPDSVREQLIFESIMDDYTRNIGICYYGNYGQLHTILNCNLNYATSGNIQVNKSMTQRLNETEELHGKIATMPYYYLNNDSSSIACRLKIFGKNILTTEEELKFRNTLNANECFYLSTRYQLTRKDLKNMFNFIIIKNE